MKIIFVWLHYLELGDEGRRDLEKSLDHVHAVLRPELAKSSALYKSKDDSIECYKGCGIVTGEGNDPGCFFGSG